jgi:hypothetical protein
MNDVRIFWVISLVHLFMKSQFGGFASFRDQIKMYVADYIE